MSDTITVNLGGQSYVVRIGGLSAVVEAALLAQQANFQFTGSEITLGDASGESLTVFDELWSAIGPNRDKYLANAGNLTANGGASLGVGEWALHATTTGTNNVALGDFAMSALTTSTGSVAVGSSAMRNSNGIDCVFVGFEAGKDATGNGVGDTGLGRRALGKATAHRNNTAVGDSALWLYQGNRGLGIGYRTAEYVASGDDAIYIGTAAGVNRADGTRVIFIGTNAGGFPALTPDPNTGAGAQDAGDRSIGIGYEALKQSTGSDHTALGDSAGASLTGGSDCVFVGSSAGNHASQKVDAAGTTVVGKGAYSTRDNEVVIGKSTDTHVTLAGVEFTKAQLEALLALV